MEWTGQIIIFGIILAKEEICRAKTVTIDRVMEWIGQIIVFGIILAKEEICGAKRLPLTAKRVLSPRARTLQFDVQ